MNQNSRITLEVDLKNLRANFAAIKASSQPCQVMAVLKANAYGLGAEPVARTLTEAGVTAFGVADINEALTLNKLGITTQIIGNILPHEITAAIEAGIVLPVNDLAGATLISREAERQQRIATAHFLVDTGMGRLGTHYSNAVEIIKAVRQLPALELTGIYSHLPSASEPEDESNQRQITTLATLIAELQRDGIEFQQRHIANSDAIRYLPQAVALPFNMVRSGLNLYGVSGPHRVSRITLKPVVTLKTFLAAVRRLPAGSYIGYGKTHQLQSSTLVGTIAAGYADGLPLALSNRGEVIIHNHRCPIIGRVSMDYTTVDLSAVPEAKYGDEVICIGESASHQITVADWAAVKQVHAYEILCSIGHRVKRQYK